MSPPNLRRGNERGLRDGHKVTKIRGQWCHDGVKTDQGNWRGGQSCHRTVGLLKKSRWAQVVRGGSVVLEEVKLGHEGVLGVVRGWRSHKCIGRTLGK